MQTKIKKEFCLLIGLLYILVGCQKQPSASSIEYIHIEYYNYLFESPVSIGCEEIKKTIVPDFEKTFIYDSANPSIVIDSMINYQTVLDTIIKDQILLKKIETEINKLKCDTLGNDIDARISVSIKYKDGTEEKICIGGYYSEQILYKGKLQLQNNRLLFLIKNNIGYYKWMPKKDMLYMDELNDTTFIRKPIESIEDNPLMH